MERMSLLSAMRGRVPRRLSTLFLAVAFLVAGGRDVLGQSGCTHHGRPEQAHAASTHASGSAAEHHGRAADEAAAQAGHSDQHDSPCTCIGTCSVTAATPLPPLGAVVSTPTISLVEGGIIRSAPEVGVSRILLRLLPFANAPPLLA